MIDPIFSKIFKSGSTTYFYSSLFFPPKIREDVYILYSFVRTLDNYVDSVPQQKKEYFEFKKNYLSAIKTKKTTNNPLIDHFISISQKYNFNPSWIRYFFASMELDLHKKTYENIRELECYMEGSAEVVGLMMAKILNLPKESYTGAKLQGKAMQFINFIRDIDEDFSLGRIYLPQKDLNKFKFTRFSKEKIFLKPDNFVNLIRFEINRHHKWQTEAETYYHFIPKRYRIPIMTAAQMYQYTATEIYKNPFVVFQKKVKPSKMKILQVGIRNIIT